MRPFSLALRCRQIWRVRFMLLVAPLAGMHVVEMQRLFVQLGRLALAPILPGRHARILIVVAEGLAIGRLIFLAEVAAAGFVALQRVEAYELGQFEEVADAAGFFERLVQLFARAQHLHVAPELLAQGGDFFERMAESFGGAPHAAVFPKQLAQVAVEGIDGTGTLDMEQAVRLVGDLRFGVAEGGVAGSFPLRQSGAEDEARMASKSLSFSSPESGLPGESWASACAHKPSARPEVRRRRVFMVIIPSELTLWRRIYSVLPINATEEALSKPGFVGNNSLICLNGKPHRASVLYVRLDDHFPPSSTPAFSRARRRTGSTLRLGPAVLRSAFAHRFGPLYPALRMVRQRCSTVSAHLVGACVHRQARLSVSYHQRAH